MAASTGPTRPPAAGQAPARKAKPDPRPARLGIGAGAIAALSVMTVGLVRVPTADEVVLPDPTPEPIAAVPREVRVEHRIRYVHLKRGQKAPAGATVIQADRFLASLGYLKGSPTLKSADEKAVLKRVD